MLNLTRKTSFFTAFIFLIAVSLAAAQGGLRININSLPTRTLYRGLRDQNTQGDVSRLQVFLKGQPNVYPEGLVTGFFGTLTEQAVQRFQKQNGIVFAGTPASTGFGMVGPKTRAVMVAIAKSLAEGGSVTVPVTITSIEPRSGVVLTKITLRGTGFIAKDNAIDIGTEKRAITGLASLDSATLTFTMPATPCREGSPCAAVVLSPGTYPIIASNKNGTSNAVSFTILAEAVKPPVIESIAPQTVKAGALITIIGSGFLPTGNKITLQSGILAQTITASSADGKTMTFIFNSAPVSRFSSSNLAGVDSATLDEVKSILLAQGLTLDDLGTNKIYGGTDRAQFEKNLQAQGYSVNDLNYRYSVLVENANGVSNETSLTEERTLPF